MKALRKISILFVLLIAILALVIAAKERSLRNGVSNALDGFTGTGCNRCFSWISVAGYSTTPGCKCQSSRGGQNYSMHINKKCLRGPDYAPHPPKGVRRIMVMGSSLFAGPGVEDDETPAAQLQKKFAEIGEKVEVINGAVEGYTSLQLYMRLKEWVDAYHPEVVLFGIQSHFPMSDRMLLALNNGTVEYLPSRLIVDPTFQLSKGPKEFLYRHDTLRKIYAALVYYSYRLRISWAFRLESNEEKREAEWMSDTLKIVEKFKEMGQHENFKPVVFLLTYEDISNRSKAGPFYDFRAAQLVDLFTPTVSFPSKKLSAALGSKEMPFFNLSHPYEKDMFLPSDYHFSVRGTTFMANNLFLQRKLYLPPRKK